MSHILEPRSLNATDVRRVHYLLITDKSSPELDQLFERRYYPPRILQQLRQETFRDDNNTVGSFIQTLLDRYHLKEAKETIQRPLRRMLIDGDISLQMRCYLICRPSLLRAFEKLECPPASKDNLNQFIEKYRRQRYTTYINLYQQRPHWENIIHAARYGHRHVLNTLIKRCPRNVSPGSVDLRNARMAALRNGHLDIYQKLSMLGEGLHPYMILLDAFSSGNLEPLAFMSLNIDTIQHVLPDLAEHVGGSGKIEAFDRLLSMSVGDPSPEIYRRCLKGAITKRCLRLFHHLKQIRSDIVEAYMPETKISCGNHIPMLQLLLAEGARRPGIFDGLHASAGHPDLLEVVTRYHPLISTHVILTLLESLMLDYNYESFDVIVDLVRYRFDGLGTELYEDVYRKILPVATKSNSAHFFDTIFGLRGNIPFSGIQVMSSIHPDIQSHIFLQCIDKFEAHPYIPLSQAISNNDKEKFDILYRRYGKKVSPERLCENAFVHGKSRYFIFLLPKCYRGWSGAIDDILKEFHLPSRLSGKIVKYLYGLNSHLHGRLLLIFSNMLVNDSGHIPKCLKILTEINDDRFTADLVTYAIVRTRINIIAILNTGLISTKVLTMAVKKCYKDYRGDWKSSLKHFPDRFVYILTTSTADCVRELTTQLEINYDRQRSKLKLKFLA